MARFAIVTSEEIPKQMPAAFRALLPEHDFALYPDLGAADAIDYAVAWKPPPGVLVGLKNLKAIFSFAAGVESFLSDPHMPRAVPIVRAVSDVSRATMSGYAMAQILRYHHKLDHYQRQQAERVWKKTMPREPAETTVTILGTGVLGADLAGRLLPFGFPVVGWSRNPKNIAGIRNLHGPASFDEAMKAGNIVVCLLPLTPQTKAILDARAFALMPAGGFVINMGRGMHVVAADLIAALDSGHLAGATLDVTEPEPLPPADPLWRHPKITITPHIAGLMPPRRIMQNMADTVRHCLKSGKFEHTADLDRGY